MSETQILIQQREELLKRLDGLPDILPPEPIRYDQYVAASAMQKATRRGDVDTALKASTNLLMKNPRKFWQRLLVIAYEDIGLADLKLVCEITSVTNNKTWRNKNGGEWVIASKLVIAMCQTVKDRTADDLLHLAEFDPALIPLRRELGNACIDKLCHLIKDDRYSPKERTLAIWMGVGVTRFQTDQLRERKGFPDQVFETFREMNIPATLITICQYADKRMGFPLAAFLPLIWHLSQGKDKTIIETDLPDSPMIGDTPAYVFDSYTRAGKQAILKWIRTTPAINAFFKDKSARQTMAIANLLHFRIESGLVDKRLQTDLADQIFMDAEHTGRGFDPKVAKGCGFIMGQHLDSLHRIRKQIILNKGE